MKKVKIEPNIVEFGAASIPCMETLKTFIPEDKLWPPDWDTWEYWGLFYNLTFNVAGVELGESLEEFIDNTQTYEAKVVKEQIEFLRQRKYQPVGSMYLYYWSDAVAMIGSGLLDYYRRPYKVYDSMKAVYTPVLVSFGWNASPYIIGKEKKYNSGEMFTGEIWVTNDMGAIENANLSWQIVNAKNEVKQEEVINVNLPEDSSRVTAHVCYSMQAGDTGEHKILMKLCDSEGEVLSENYFDFTIC
jgi:beta-mannosidase